MKNLKLIYCGGNYFGSSDYVSHFKLFFEGKVYSTKEMIENGWVEKIDEVDNGFNVQETYETTNKFPINSVLYDYDYFGMPHQSEVSEIMYYYNGKEYKKL